MDPNQREGQSSALDLTNHRDIETFGHALRMGWQVTPERKRAYFAALDDLIRNADAMPINIRYLCITAANRCLQMEQAAALKDLHQVEEYKRLDEGKPTGNIQHIIDSNTPLRAKRVASKEVEKLP